MGVSNHIIIDITNSLHRVDEIFNISTTIELDDSILPYAYASFTAPTVVDIDYRCIDDEIDVLGDITLTYMGACDKCGERAFNSIVVSIDETFYPDQSDDQYYYTGTKLDLTQAIIDSILLQLPTSLLCRQQCRGLCPICGTNLSVSQCECIKIQ